MINFLPALLTTGVVIENGGTDAPNAVSACVASGALTSRRASILAAVCNFAGAAVSGLLFPRVANTLAELTGMADGAGLAALTASMLAVLIWTGAAWLLSVPTSESHALLAAMAGAAFYAGGDLGLKSLALMLGIAAGSCIAGWVGGKLAGFLVKRLTLGEKQLGRLQIILAGAGATLHGAQDGQKFMCVFALSLGATSDSLPVFAVLWCSAVLAFGTALCGKKMLSLAGNLGVDSRRRGLSADIGGAAALLLFTLLGLPVSTTHIKTASAAGAGGASTKSRKTFLQLCLAWVITFPLCWGLGYLLVPAADFLLKLA